MVRELEARSRESAVCEKAEAGGEVRGGAERWGWAPPRRWVVGRMWGRGRRGGYVVRCGVDRGYTPPVDGRETRW